MHIRKWDILKSIKNDFLPLWELVTKAIPENGLGKGYNMIFI